MMFGVGMLLLWMSGLLLNKASQDGSVNSIPAIVIATSGDNVTLECESSSGPNNTFIWFHNISSLVCKHNNCSNGIFTFDAQEEEILNATVGDTQTIQVNNIDASDGGEYSCLVFNEAGIGIGTSEIFVRPYFTQHPTDMAVDYHDRVELSCEAEAFPEPIVQWQFSNTYHFENLDIFGSSLVFMNILVSNSGVYRCAATNVINGTEHTAFSTMATVLVNPISPYNVSISGPIYLVSGEEVSYNCTANGAPDNVHVWTIDGIEIANNEEYTINTIMSDVSSFSELTILSVDAATNQGTFYCNVTNLGGSGEGELLVTVSPRNIVHTTPTNISVARGDDVSFTCHTDAGPDTLYLWLYNISNLVCVNSNCSDGIFAFNASNEEILTTAFAQSMNLSLTNTSAPNQGGEYVCIAFNDAGIDYSITKLYFPPQIFEQPLDVKVLYVNEAVFLRCNAEAFPFPNYQWQKRNLANVFEDLHGENGEIFSEPNVTHSHAGAYHCLVSNNINDNVTVIVSRVAIIHVTLNDTVRISVRTSGEFINNNLYVEDGGWFQILCLASGGPNNMHIWKRDGIEITSDAGFNISSIVSDTSSKSELSVNKINAITHKGGIFTCEVTNEVGYDISTLNVTISPSGIVVTSPETVIRNKNESVSFNCSSDAGPMNQYFWLYNASEQFCMSCNRSNGMFNLNFSTISLNDSFIGTEQQITLHPPLYGGAYTCFVVNDAGIGQSTSVLYIPVEITSHPQSVNATAGSIFRLTCTAEGYPYFTIQWQKSSGSGSIEILNGENGFDLEFNRSTYDSFGTYRCLAVNNINGINFTSFSNPAVVAISPENSVAISPNFVMAAYEDNVVLQCLRSGGPDNQVDWFLNDTKVISSAIGGLLLSFPFTHIVISAVNAQLHGGTYKCIVNNEAGSGEDSVEFFVVPRFVTQPQTVLTSEGRDAVLICEAEAFPYPDYMWINVTNNMTNYMVGTGARLEFTPVKYGDEGVYQCIVFSNDTTVASNEASVHVSPYGSVDIMPSFFIAKLGEDYTAICSGRGGLYNQFKWTHLQTGITSSFSPSLVLANVTLLDGGIYECSVKNLAGADSKFFTLYFVPNVVEDPVPQNVSRMDDIVLNCSVAGFPIPFMTWFHNNTQVELSDRIEITNYHLMERTSLESDYGIGASELTISSAEVNDTGLYHCQADFVLFAISEAVNVFVQVPPQPPHSLHSENVYSRNLTLLWRRPFDNNAPILGYFVFYFNPSFINEGSQVTLRLNEDIETITILDLHPGELYVFTVVAFNQEGNSSQSLEYRIQTQEEAPIGSPQMVTARPLSATSIFIEWKELLIQDELGKIVGFDVFYAEALNRHTGKWKILEMGNFSTVVHGLKAFTGYSLSVRARTAVGPGPLSQPYVIRTKESSAGLMNPPEVINITSAYAVFTWNPPQEPNGIIIHYNIEIDPLGYIGTMRPVEDVLSCYSLLNIAYQSSILAYGEAINISVVPYTQYRLRISASTIAGAGNFSQYTFFSTLEADRAGVVDNLRGTAYNGTSVVLSWSVPLCPNGPITGYYVFYRRAESTQSIPISSSRYSSSLIRSNELPVFISINGFTLGQTYSFHVRAFSNEMDPGLANKEILLTLSSQVSLNNTDDLQSVLSRVAASSQTLLIGLPSSSQLASIGITNIVYYGVVVTLEPSKQFRYGTNNFETEYPNVQPYDNRGDNQYYIAAGWNNELLIPDDFSAGDKTRTTAIRNGVEETYYNAELNPETMYCLYILLNYVSEVENTVIVRYAQLSCQSTESGFKIATLVVGSSFTFLLLASITLLIIIFFMKYYKRKWKKTQTLQPPADMIIQNPAFIQEKSSKGIPIADFSAYVKYLHSNDDRMFSEEFSVIEPLHNATTLAAIAHKSKNRFQNYAAYDHSRVILNDHLSDSSYINANFIKGYARSGDFIATQGPMKNTVEDFWSMIWQKDVYVIVMLTELKETKCHKYWPDTLHGMSKYGPIEVKLNEEVNKDYYDVRSLLISCEEQKRLVQQFHFKTWKDYQIPKHLDELLGFVNAIRCKNKQQDLPPIVVHCSSGVGQTAVFIALYVQLERAEYDQTIDVKGYVQYMRKERPSMVLNETEYIFIHDILLEAVRSGLIKDEGKTTSTVENRYKLHV